MKRATTGGFDPAVFEHVDCNFCGSREYAVTIEPKRIPARDELAMSVSWGERDTQRIVTCRQCGLVYVNPRPRSDLVLSHYEKEAEHRYAEEARSRMDSFRRSLRFVEKYAQGKGVLLDIGAAAGFFVKVARDAGWEASGIEPNTWLCRYAEENLGIRLLNSPLGGASLPPASFEAITMWDVIEHMHDPSDVLRHAHRLLKPNGVLVLSTPNAASLLARLFGRRWWFYLSVHLYYFSPDTLARRMEQLGFRVLAVNRYFQTLTLGHLTGMFGMYSKPLSAIANRALSGIGLHDLPIRYYASQFVLAARKA